MRALHHGWKAQELTIVVVKTPLWTEDSQKHKLKYIDEAQDEWVTTTEVAGAMLKLAEDPEIVGGTVLECGHEQTRSIPLFGNTGPSGAGHSLANAAVSVEELYGWVNEPGWGRVAS